MIYMKVNMIEYIGKHIDTYFLRISYMSTVFTFLPFFPSTLLSFLPNLQMHGLLVFIFVIYFESIVLIVTSR